MRATSPHVLHTLLWLVPFVKLHHYNEFARDLLFYAHHWFRDLLIRFLSVFSRDRSQTRKGPSISCLRRISVANFIRKPNLCLRMAMWPLANQILFKNPLQRHDGSHRRPFFFFKKKVLMKMTYSCNLKTRARESCRLVTPYLQIQNLELRILTS